MRATFCKDERLCSKKIIAQLFESGQSFFIAPFKVIYLKTSLPTTYEAQCAFAVSKRNFSKAHDRNQIKRYLREAYRLNKFEFLRHLKEDKKQIAFVLIYASKTITTFNESNYKMKLILNRLITDE